MGRKMQRKTPILVSLLAGFAIQAGAALTIDWSATEATVLGTNFTLNIGIDGSGSYSLVSAENVPAAVTFSASGSVGFSALYSKTFSLNFSSVNGQNMECQSVAGAYRLGMTGGVNKWRFDLPTEALKISADLSGIGTNESLQLQTVQLLNVITNYVIGIRDSSGTELLTATNPAGNATLDLSSISPLLPGGQSDFFEFRATEGSAGGLGDLVFEFSSQGAPEPVIQLANIFSSGCVLQRDRTVAVWGCCQPDETITLEIKSQIKNTVADSNGNWRVELDPEPAGGPFTMTVSGTVSRTVTLLNVYFGDVWIFTGQSNMFQTLGGQVSGFPNDYPPVPDATDDFDDMRLAIVAIATSNSPATDVTMDIPWSRWDPAVLGNMSAVGYFFARFLNEQLDANGLSGVPLGFIKVCKGGTAIEEWIAAEEIAAAQAVTPDLNIAADASGYYNGMIAPIQDYAIKGALWYQGEGNAGLMERILQYPILKEVLVSSWRTQWNNPDLPFYFVQLAPYRRYSIVPSDNELWPRMRESQRACLSITNTAMACIIDGGLQGNIHPPFKDRAGERLARIALTKTYDIPFVCRGPTVQDVQINGSEVTITFDNVAGGLETRAVDSQPDAEEVALLFPPVSISASELGGFALCGTNQTFYWATQAEIISSNQVRISNATDVPAPAFIRYAWQNYPRCNLFNSEGLPAEPFRTDAYEYSTASGADSTPHSAGISNRFTRAEQGVIEIDLATVFSDIEDGSGALGFSVTGNTDTNVVSASVSNQVLYLTLSGNAGTSSVTVVAQDSSGKTAQSTFTVTAETSAYKVWRHGYFTEAQLSNTNEEAAVWGDLADPDTDGIPNLLEYALAQSPVETNGTLRPVSIVREDGAIKARFLRSKEAAADASVAVGLQTNSDLAGAGPWAVSGAADTLYQDLGQTELRDVVLAPVQDGEQKLFVRLYISRTE